MDLNNKCRTCLRILKHPKHLFSDDKLLNKIKIISSVKIENVSELPSQICEECFKNINRFYNFRKVIINTEQDLQKRLLTVKQCYYTPKPRSKMKHYPEISDNSINFHIEIKSEPDIDNIVEFSDSENNLEDDNVKKAILMEELFRCPECNELFATRIKLRNHKRTTHRARAVCNICGKFVTVYNLKKHMDMHLDKPSTCEECGKVFKNPELLRTHRTHTHSKQSFSCDICGMILKLKAEHTRHLRRHYDPDCRKKPCSVCGKKVWRLTKHMLIHTGEKPNVCNFCNRGFTSAHALKVHTRQHTKERPYICEYCSNSFTQRVSLKTHLKTKHGVPSKEQGLTN